MRNAAPKKVLAARQGPVLVLTLNRPHRLNAVTARLYEELIRKLEGAEADPAVRSVVLTGAGRAFSAGADLKRHREAPPTDTGRRRYAALGQAANRLLQTIGVPVVAAVNGPAVGAGLELALSADFAIAASDAKLRLPEIALGTFVGGGVTYTLPERVGTVRARELLYLGDFFSGAEAATLGVVHRALPAEEVLPEAIALAGRLARRAPRPLAKAKRLLRAAPARSREAALAAEQAALEEIFGTEDWREGLCAFAEGRPPRFRGT